jgi:hypothetical protein
MYNCGPIRIGSGSRTKVDVVQKAEGIRPGRDMASVRVTVGVLDQGMFSKGWLGNWGDPEVALPQAVRYQGRKARSEQT